MSEKMIYICRHGETLANVEGIIQGQLDGELTPRGIAQARARGISLKDKGIQLIMCGDLYRQKETAIYMMDHVKAPIRYSQLLRERGAGELEGKSFASLGLDEKTAFSYYDKDGEGILAPLERFCSVTRRAQDMVDYLKRAPHEAILLIGSGGIDSYMTNILLREKWIFRDQPNCSMHQFSLDAEGEVLDYRLVDDL